MKRIGNWVVPALLSMTAIVWASACSSTDPSVTDDPATGDDAGAGSKTDSSTPSDDSGTDSKDSGTKDATNDDADSGDGFDAGLPDDYMIACARIDACAATGTPRIGMNGCYSLITAQPFARDLDPKERAQLENLECKLKATTCAEVQACDKPLNDYVQLCQDAQGGDHCSGNVHVVCDAETFAPVAVADCAASGKVCGGDTGFFSGCGIAPCDPDDPDASASTCNGTTLKECTWYGVTREIDCTTANSLLLVNPIGKKTIGSTTCATNEFGQAQCVADGAECTGFVQRCDGTVLETCNAGKLARRDCANALPAGQGCVVLTDVPEKIKDAYGCGPVNPTCHPTDNETCNPSTGVIGFCGLTGPKSLDCKALGYAGCKTTTVDGRVTAACFQ